MLKKALVIIDIQNALTSDEFADFINDLSYPKKSPENKQSCPECCSCVDLKREAIPFARRARTQVMPMRTA